MQTEINELQESMSDNSTDINSSNEKNSNGKRDNNNNNSEKAAYRDNKYSEKVKEIKTLKTQLVTVEDALKESDR